MKRKHLLPAALLMLLCSATARAQQGIAVNASGNAPDSSAMLDVQSNAKGMLVPRMNAMQRTGIATPANGLLVYDTDSAAFFFYKGTAWTKIAIGNPSGADNLGNHTATQTVKLNNNWLSNDGGAEGIRVDNSGRVGIGNSAPGASLDVSGTFSSGAGHTVSGTNATVLGGQANTASGGNAIAGGNLSYASATNSIAIGQADSATGTNAVAFGLNNKASGTRAFTTGLNNIASGNASVAQGQNATASAWGSVAIGLYIQATNNGAVALGSSSQADGITAVSLGYENQATGNYSVAIGRRANTNNQAGSFVFADSIASGTSSDAVNQMKMRFTGGYKLFANPALSSGIQIAPTTGVAKYFSNVASSYDARSLVDKNYVDSSNLATGGADNLGNHTATQNVQLNNNWLSNDGGAEGIRVDNSGNVGVGTGSPVAQSKLTVAGSASFTGADGNFGLGGNRSLVDYWFNWQRIGTINGGGAATNGILFLANNSERMRLESTGNLGINNSAPAEKLDVVGNIKSSDTVKTNKFKMTNGAAAGYVLVSDATGNAIWQAAPAVTGDNLGNHTATQVVKLNNNWLSNDGGAEGIRVADNGNVGVGTATPGAKLDVAGTGAIGSGHIVTGGSAFATGYADTASGYVSVAMGRQNTASANHTVALGWNNKATGGQAFAAGSFNTASGDQAFALGYQNTAPSNNEMVVGACATIYTPGSTTGYVATDRIFNVGNGVNAANRADAFTILKNGNVGVGNAAPTNKLDVSGTVSANNPGTTPTGSAIQLSSAANDPGVIINRGDGAGGQAQRWDVKITSDSALTFRNNNSSTAMVIRNNGNVGIGTTSPNTTLSVIGSANVGSPNNIVTGSSSMAIGAGDTASGYASFAANRQNAATGNHASAFGGYNQAPSYDEFAIGYYGTLYTPASATGFVGTDRLFNVGNGSSALRSDAFTILKSGKTGIGNNTPAEKLDVTGNIKSTDTVKTGKLQMSNGATAGYVLRSDAAGNAVWVNPTTLTVTGDNLGNHTATQNVQLNNNWLSNDGGAEGIRIDNSGNVGVGTATPGSKLEVSGAVAATNPAGTASGTSLALGSQGSDPTLAMQRGDGAGSSGIRWDMKVSSDSAIRWRYNNTTDRMYLSNAGSLGLGTTSPVAQSRLTVAGSASFTGADGNFGLGGNRGLVDFVSGYLRIGTIQGGGASATNGIQFLANNAERMRLLNSGYLGINNSAPAERLDVVGNIKSSDTVKTGKLVVSSAVKIGASGTTITDFIKVTGSGAAATVSANSTQALSFPVSGAAPGASVHVSPSADLPNGLVIACTRVSAAGTVSVSITNPTGSDIALSALSYFITVIN